MPLATDTLTTHIIAILSWWETYRQRLLFLLDINQLDYTAGCWVHFSIWIRFSLYAVHVVLINQNSHHITIIFLYCTLIYCCHSWLLHKDAATQSTGPEYVDEAAGKGGPLKQIRRLTVLSKNWTNNIIIIIIIITTTIFINCNWVVTRWQWLFYMYTNMGGGVTRKFKSGGLHLKHVVATGKLGNHLSIRL